MGHVSGDGISILVHEFAIIYYLHLHNTTEYLGTYIPRDAQRAINQFYNKIIASQISLRQKSHETLLTRYLLPLIVDGMCKCRLQ